MIPTVPRSKRARRNRDSERRGKSDRSWIKHDLFIKAVGAQVAAFRWRFPDAKMLLIDGNAGDGDGVPMRQLDWINDAQSRPTPQLLADLARKHNATLCLCERNRAKRKLLAVRFPGVNIVSSHAEAAKVALDGFNYVLWLSDPCGPAGHGVEHMRKVAMQVLRSDFVIALNEHTLERFVGAAHSPFWKPHQKYVPMADPTWWLGELPKRFLARTPIIKQSSNFRYRILVISDFVTDGVKRLRNIEIIRK